MSAIAWLGLGCLWWGLILFSLFAAPVYAPNGKKGARVGMLAAVEGALALATTLVPAIGAFVWIPILFVAMLPFVIVSDLLGFGAL